VPVSKFSRTKYFSQNTLVFFTVVDAFWLLTRLAFFFLPFERLREVFVAERVILIRESCGHLHHIFPVFELIPGI
jgi:hypothetical protein